jgi:ABC-type spermidine/putrescine transport system permease subunit II
MGIAVDFAELGVGTDADGWIRRRWWASVFAAFAAAAYAIFFAGIVGFALSEAESLGEAPLGLAISLPLFAAIASLGAGLVVIFLATS